MSGAEFLANVLGWANAHPCLAFCAVWLLLGALFGSRTVVVRQ